MIRRYKLQIKQLSDDYKLIVDEYETLTKRYEKLSNETKNYKLSNKMLNNELITLEKTKNEANTNNNPILSEYQSQILESRIILLSKQKKHLENLINKYISTFKHLINSNISVCKTHTSKDTFKIVSSILSLAEGAYTLEKEKIKLEKMLNQLDEELKKNSKIDSDREFDTDKILKKERDHLIIKIGEINKNISS